LPLVLHKDLFPLFTPNPAVYFTVRRVVGRR